MTRRTGLAAVVALVVLPVAPAAGGAPAKCRGSHWVGAWKTAPGTAGFTFAEQTLRQVVNPAHGGRRVRVRLSNRLGDRPVTFARVSVARRARGARLVPGSVRPVAFRGRRAVTVAPGREVVSDPVPFRVRAFRDVAVDLYFREPAGPATLHPLATETSSWIASGDRAGRLGADGFGGGRPTWFFLTGLEVLAPRRVGTIVALGDSITDGYNSQLARPPGTRNTRWTDVLARRLARAGRPLSIVNAGIAGNRVLRPGALPLNGPSALSRLDSDVLATPGLTDVVLFEGINDFGQPPNVAAGDLIAGLRAAVTRLRARGARVLLGTLTPARDFGFAGWGSLETDVKRRAVNAWIRRGGVADGYVDFDAALRDPGDPDRLLPRYDSGNHLHPNARGYARMAEAVRLGAFRGARCR